MSRSAQNRQRQVVVSDVKERFESLTQREKEVMQLLITGMLGKQIAIELGISSRTVEKFRANIMKKMKANSVASLVLSGVSLGLHLSPKSRFVHSQITQTITCSINVKSVRVDQA